MLPHGGSTATDGARAAGDFEHAQRIYRPGHGGQIHALALSPDGRTIAAGGSGGVIRFFDAATGRPGSTLPGNKYLVFSLTYSADGKRLVSAGSDTTWTVPN